MSRRSRNIRRAEELALADVVRARRQRAEVADEVRNRTLSGLSGGELPRPDELDRRTVTGLHLPREVAGAVQRGNPPLKACAARPVAFKLQE
jgi:hypothetical protein